MEHLFLIDGAKASEASKTTLAEADLQERAHLQEWVVQNPDILGDDVLIVTTEYDKWAADVDGAPAKDRLDILGLDGSGRLVVVELKRDTANRDIHLQAITYAALVSRFDIDTLADAHYEFMLRKQQTLSLEDCREKLLTHAGGDLDPKLLRSPRQVLIAKSFPKQVTHTVVWLSEMNLDIDLIQVGMWRVGNNLVAGFTKIYPTPEVEEFTLAPAREATSNVTLRAQERTRTKNAVHTLVEASVIPDGARLLLVPSHGTTDVTREAITDWVAKSTDRSIATWRNKTAKPLQWEADKQYYSPTGLASHIFTTVTDKKPDGIQGTTWWVIDGSHPPEGADPNDWLAFDNKSLVTLASEYSRGVAD